MLADRFIAVLCFSLLFVTTTTAVEAKTSDTSDAHFGDPVLSHHSDKPWEVGDVSCGK